MHPGLYVKLWWPSHLHLGYTYDVSFFTCSHRQSLTGMLLVATAVDAPAADIISGVPRIHDGDTLTIGEVTIRLEGINSPETEQVCLDQQNAKWQCGIAARDHLVEHVANRPSIAPLVARMLIAAGSGFADLPART